MQKSILITLSASFLACCASRATADSPGDHLKGFDHFIGRWILTETAKEDTPLVQKGSKLVAYNEFKWTPNKQAVIFNWILKIDDQESILANHLIVWDMKTRKITCFWQRSDGEQGTTDWSFEGATLVGKVQSIDTEGHQSTGTAYFEPKGADAYTWWATEMIRDGERQPDISKYEYSRIE
jgi:hypothetical protein